MATPLQKRTLPVGGIPVHLYSDPVEQEAQLPVVVVFVLHGRYGDSDSKAIIALIDKLFAEVREKRSAGEKIGKQLLVATIDHRNHGWRIIDKKSNDAWDKDPAKDNEKHALDMFTIQTGTARDVSFLIDFLEAYLFPSGENTVVEWGVIGFSLGGHSTWILLRDDPRVVLGIAIVGCPNYEALMKWRAKQTFGTPGLEPPRYPQAFREYVARGVSVRYSSADASNPFYGKKILVLSGQEDQLVHWSASKDFIDALEVGPNGVKRVIVEEGVGHTMTERARQEAGTFVAERLAS